MIKVIVNITISSSDKACNNGICYGHALSETNYWYRDSNVFINIEHPWSSRGGYATSTTTAGVFYFAGTLSDMQGGKGGGTSTHIVIIS